MAIIEGTPTKDKRKYSFKIRYKDLQGNTKQYLSIKYKLQSEAKEAERLFLLNVKNENSNIIIFNDLYVSYINFKKQIIKKSSIYGIEKRCKKHILNYFKNIKLDSITIDKINIWKLELDKTIEAVSYKNSLITNLKSILKYGVIYYNFNQNILSKITLYPSHNERKKQIEYWTFEEFNNFINIVDNEYYKLIFNFLYYTGVRKGEMFALNWNDLSFKNKELNIDKTLNYKVNDKLYDITTPKTKKSYRKIDIPNNLINDLKEYYNTLKNKKNFTKDMFIFGNTRPIPQTTLTRQFDKYIKIAQEKYDIKHITIHGLRHSHVSLLINNGCDEYEVADRLGHTIEMTRTIYFHMFPIKKKNAVNILNNLTK